jgi:hypothetical protein
MKFVASLLVLFLVAQPLQAGFCAMEMAGQPAAQSSMKHMHGGMERSQSHDCCKQQAPKQKHDCSSSNHCGACAAGHSAVPVRAAALQIPESIYRFSVVEPGLPPSHSSPPFRPPISLI